MAARLGRKLTTITPQRIRCPGEPEAEVRQRRLGHDPLEPDRVAPTGNLQSQSS